MTTEERLNRIEHVTAGIDEERRKDREENRQLWRDTQRQIEDIDRRLGERIDQMARESGEANRRLEARIEQMAEESRAAHKRLEETDERLAKRIDGLASAIGQLIARMGIPPQPTA